MLVKDFLQEDLISGLLAEGIINQQQIDQLLTDQKEKKAKLGKTIFEKIFLLDLPQKKLRFFDGMLNEISVISLSETKEAFIADEWEQWGSGAIIFGEENKKIGDFPGVITKNYGFALSGQNTFLYTENMTTEKNLLRLENYVLNSFSKNKNTNFPTDLTISRDQRLLVISDRLSGTLQLIDLQERKLINTFSIRNPGNNKAINVAISNLQKKIFVTDNQSTSITIIDLENFQTEVKNPGMGIMGNILLDPKEEQLYCLITKPKPILKLISLKDFSATKEFTLKGELYSSGDIPYDLLTISPERKFVYLQTHIPEPNPFTPVITVIDTEKEKAVQRFSLKDGLIPANIGFSQINPNYFIEKDLLELLSENNLINQEQIDLVKNKLQENEQKIMLSEEIAQFTPLINDFNSTSPTLGEPAKTKKAESEWKINKEPKKIGFANISPGIDEVLYNKCKDSILKDWQYILERQSLDEFWEEKELEIEKRFKAVRHNLEKKDKLPAIRLKDAITKARQELEWHDLAIIRLIDLLENYNFEFSFEREEVLELLRQKERDELIETGLKTIPNNCPNCEAPLLGSYVCRMCGFELEKPEEALRRKLLQISTYDPFMNLPNGHLMLLDRKNHRVFEIDHFRKIIWQIQKDVLHTDVEVELDMPYDAVRLKNKITLVVDYGLNRVFKLTERGRVYWEMNYDFSPEHKLKNPVSASALESGNIIIVDHGNHRVLEVDEDSEIRWSYGQKGISGLGENLLNFPAYFQRTAGGTNIITDTMNHRIIELGEKKALVWQYGNPENKEGDEGAGNEPGMLKMPLSAWRMLNQNTLILDSGNHRIIEVNQEKEIVWEFQTDSGEEENRIINPIKVYLVRHSDTILILGENKVIEVSHDEEKKIIWACSINEFNSIRTGLTDSDDGPENVKKMKVRHGVAGLYTKRVLEETEEEKERKERLKAIMDGKRSDLAGRANSILRSPVILSPGAKVSPAEFSLLDKNKGDLYRIDRKGNHIWFYSSSQNGLAKPQFIFDLPDSILVADGEQKKVLQIELNSKKIIWSYEGDENEKLVFPRSVELTEKNTILIADQQANKVLEIEKNSGKVIWFYKNFELLKTPFYASRLKNGNTIIIDWSSHIVLEISPEKDLVWSYGVAKKPGREDGCLSYPESAERIANGNTLIADTRNSRVIEVDPDGKIVWEYEGKGINKIMSPTIAKRMSDGNTLIYYSNNKYIVEVDAEGKVLWKYTHHEKRL